MKIGAIDLFCGIGGLTNGIQRSGIKVIAGIDLDESCSYAFEVNNNSKFIGKSIHDVTGKEIKKLLRGYEIKVLVGCAPCQPFSNHRKDKKNREAHKDWSLLYQFARIVEEVKPHFVSMENVPALVSEKVFIDFIDTIKRLGYHYDYSIVNSADYGVPQNRKRLILIASKQRKIKLIEPTNKKNQTTVRKAISHLRKVNAGEMNSVDRLHITSGLSELNHKRIRASRPNGTWKDWPEELMLDCHKKDSGKSYSSVYGRMSWESLAPTITTQFTGYGTGRFGHPEQDRALTLREGAIIQTFPEDYLFIRSEEEVNIKSISRHIGNAVPPRLGEIIGESIIKVLPRKRIKE